MRCSVCSGEGHNIRTCPVYLTKLDPVRYRPANVIAPPLARYTAPCTVCQKPAAKRWDGRPVVCAKHVG